MAGLAATRRKSAGEEEGTNNGAGGKEAHKDGGGKNSRPREALLRKGRGLGACFHLPMSYLVGSGQRPPPPEVRLEPPAGTKKDTLF